jgi:IclR family mhp operon transcriptional activator
MPEQHDGGTVRAVARALTILELLTRHQALGLEELHQLAQLPKPTLVRLLSTLQERGWIWRRLCDRRYTLSAERLAGDDALRFRQRLSECAAPQLQALSERTGLVADLALFTGQRMELLDSAIPLRWRNLYRGQRSGATPHLCHSAMGRALVGELDIDTRRQLAGQDRRLARELEAIQRQTRSAGCGIRTEGYWEYGWRLPFAIRALALPLFYHGRPVGSIALHWPQPLDSVDNMRRRHLDTLTASLRAVEAALAAH